MGATVEIKHCEKEFPKVASWAQHCSWYTSMTLWRTCTSEYKAMYADDLVLWCSEESIYVAKNRIQQAFDVLYKWTKRWMVRLNAGKTTYKESCVKNRWRMLKAWTQSHIPGHHFWQATNMEIPHWKSREESQNPLNNCEEISRL